MAENSSRWREEASKELRRTSRPTLRGLVLLQLWLGAEVQQHRLSLSSGGFRANSGPTPLDTCADAGAGRWVIGGDALGGLYGVFTPLRGNYVVLSFPGSAADVSDVERLVGDWSRNIRWATSNGESGSFSAQALCGLVFLCEQIEAGVSAGSLPRQGLRVYLTGYSQGGLVAQMAAAMLVESGGGLASVAAAERAGRGHLALARRLADALQAPFLAGGGAALNSPGLPPHEYTPTGRAAGRPNFVCHTRAGDIIGSFNKGSHFTRLEIHEDAEGPTLRWDLLHALGLFYDVHFAQHCGSAEIGAPCADAELRCRYPMDGWDLVRSKVRRSSGIHLGKQLIQAFQKPP